MAEPFSSYTTNPLMKTHGICPPEDPRWHWMPSGMASSVTASREGSLGSGEVPRCKIATAKRKNRHYEKKKKNPQEGGSGKQTMIALMRLKINITKSKDQLIFHLIAAALRKTEFEMAITSTFNVAREGKEMRRESYLWASPTNIYTVRSEASTALCTAAQSSSASSTIHSQNLQPTD